MNGLKLGKKPAAPRATDFKFAKYVDRTVASPMPASFGFEGLYPKMGWGELGNSEQGDCAWASAAHETMVWNKSVDRSVSFTTQGVLADYHACTGPGDNGTDMHDEMSYRQKTGIIDSSGKRHKIGAYLSLDPGSLQDVYHAMWYFDCVAIGIEFPASAMTQFNNGQMWTHVNGSEIEGGHAIAFIGKRNHLEVVTWGQLQLMSVPFFETYCDEAYAIVSPDSLSDSGLTARGFDVATLNADLAALK